MPITKAKRKRLEQLLHVMQHHNYALWDAASKFGKLAGVEVYLPEDLDTATVESLIENSILCAELNK